MNKKAVSMAFVVVAIIILLLTFTLLIFIGTVFQKTGQATIEEKCRVSVEREALINSIAAKTGAGHTLKDFATNVECQTIPLDMRGKDEKAIASSIRMLIEKCWKTFGKGGLALFSRGEGIFCHVCYSLTIDPKTTVDIDTFLKSQQEWLLKDKYDAQSPLAVETGIVFFNNRDSAGAVTSKIYVRPLNALDVCKDAEFPRQRL